MFNQILSIILIIVLTGSLITQVGISSVNALSDPATGIKASSNFGTLQIDRSEYDVTYVNNTAVKVSGTIATLNSIDTRVTILFTLPDGSTKGSQIAPNGDGTFQTSLPLDSNSQKGTYSVSASYAQNTLGALTFTVKLVPVATSTLPIKPHIEQSKRNSINNVTQITQSTSNSSPNLQTASKIPGWVQHVFLWYGQGQVSEDELLGAIKFLVNSGIIQLDTKYSVPNSTTSSNLHPQPNINTQSENQPATNSLSTNPTPSNQQPTNSQQSQSTQSMADSQISNFNFRYIHANPNNYKNDWIKFVGKISYLQPDDNTIEFDTSPNSSDLSNEVYVKLMYNYTSQYSTGNCLLIEGHVTGSDEYTYLGNVKATNLQMNGEKVTKISCVDAVDPAMNTIIVNQSQTIGDAKITLEKVEFAQDETRVKIIFENIGNSADVNIMPGYSHVFQGTSQMDIKYTYGDNNDVKTSISSGVISEGYLFFEPAKSGKISVVIDEYSISSAYTENKFTFNVG